MWDFVANATVDSLDTVPDEFKGLYEADKASGKFGIAAHAKGIVDNYVGMAKRYDTLAKQRKDDNQKDAARRMVLKSVTDVIGEMGWEIGDDESKLGEVLKTNLSSLVEANKAGKQNKIDLDKVKADFDKRFAAEKAKFDAELGVMQGSLTEHMLTASAVAALAEAGTVEKGVDLLMPIIHKAAKVIKTEDGKYAVRVVDADGNVRVNGKAEPMAVKELVAELKTTYPMAFKSENKGGGGQPPNAARTGAGRQSPQQKAAGAAGAEEMTGVQKIAAGLKAGLLNK